MGMKNLALGSYSFSWSIPQGSTVDVCGGLACKGRRQVEFGIYWVASLCVQRSGRQLDIQVWGATELSPTAIGFVISALLLRVRHVPGLQTSRSFTLRILLAAIVFGVGSASSPAEEVTFQIWGFTTVAYSYYRPSLFYSFWCWAVSAILRNLARSQHYNFIIVISLIFMWHFNIQEKGIYKFFSQGEVQRQSLLPIITHTLLTGGENRIISCLF